MSVVNSIVTIITILVMSIIIIATLVLIIIAIDSDDYILLYMVPFPFQTGVTMAMSKQRRLHLAVN